MVSQRDVRTADGRTVHAYDTGETDAAMTIVWHHGSPQTGALLEPLLAAAAERNIRMLSYGRPSYGGSGALRERSVGSAAADVAQVTDAHGVDKFAVMGASGGGPHALACAALLPERVTGVVSIAGLAPLPGNASPADTSEWFRGMASPGGLRSAIAGREARAHHAAIAEFDPHNFIDADWAALDGSWASLGADVARSEEFGSDGLIDDDVAFVSQWGFDLAQIDTRVLIVQGGEDRVVPASHAMWLLNGCRRGELWLRPSDGHISILDACPVAMDWLKANARA